MKYETLNGKAVNKFEFRGYMLYFYFGDIKFNNRGYNTFRRYLSRTIAVLIISKGVEVRYINVLVHGSPEMLINLIENEEKYALLGDQRYWKFYPSKLFQQVSKNSIKY